MSTQLFLIIAAVFVLGLFLGSNVGIVLMCVLQMADRSMPVRDDLVSLTAKADQ